MSKVEVIVKIEKNYKDKLLDIAAQCKSAGMSVEQQMSAPDFWTNQERAQDLLQQVKAHRG